MVPLLVGSPWPGSGAAEPPDCGEVVRSPEFPGCPCTHATAIDSGGARGAGHYARAVCLPPT